MPKLEVRLSAEEKERLQKDAEDCGLSVSAFVRATLFAPPPFSSAFSEGPPQIHKQPSPTGKPFGADRFKK